MLKKKGVIVVCAAGNEGDDNPLTNERSFPAMWDEAISVAAVSKKEGLPVVYFSNTNPQVDYAGIGQDVVSFKPEGGYQTMSGTSMAAPHVSGLIAALLSKDSGLDLGKAKTRKNTLMKILNETYVKDIGVEGKDLESGHGFLSYLDKEELDEMLSS